MAYTLLDSHAEDLRGPSEFWEESFPLPFAMLFGGAHDVGVERSDISATLDVPFLLHDSPIGVGRCGEKRTEISTPIPLVLAREP